MKVSDMQELHKAAVHDPEGQLMDSYAAAVKEKLEYQKSIGRHELSAGQYAELKKHPLKREEVLVRSASENLLPLICKECFGEE